MKKIIFPLTFISLLHSQVPLAGEFGDMTYGPGVATCEQWVAERQVGKERKRIQAYQIESWVQGYISGITIVLAINKVPNLAETSSEAMFTWMDKECEENPQKSIAFAALGLAVAMGLEIQ